MKYAYLYLPGILILLLPVMKAIVDGAKADAKRKRQIAEKERREAERREALRKANEDREAQKAAEKAAAEAAEAAMPKRGPGRPRKDPAEKAAAEAAKAAMPKRKPGRPRKEPAPEQRPENISPAAQPVAHTPIQDPAPAIAEPAAPVAPKRPVAYIGNNQFVGETVAFTGTLPGMTRREAIEAVKKNGGKAYENMPAGTTILVVGDNPGRNKLDNADKWIGSCRKISALEFRIMLDTPLTLTPEQFADYVHAVYAA